MGLNKYFGDNELFKALASVKKILWAAGSFSFVINALMLLPSIYMMQVYDRVLASRNEMTLMMITIIILFLYSILGTLEWVRSQILLHVSIRLDNQINERVFTASFDACLRGFAGNPAQAINDWNNIRQFLAGNGLLAFFDAPWSPIFLIVLTLLHPWLGLLSLLGGTILIGLTYLTEQLTHRHLASANTEAMQASNFANNNLRNAEAIEAMGMLAQMRQRWLEKHRNSLALQEYASNSAAFVGAATRFVRLSLQSLILGLGAWLVIRGDLSPGAMIAASILMGRVLSPIEQLISTWKNLAAVRSSYERLLKLLQTCPIRTSGMLLPTPSGNVSLENATACAPNSRTPIIKNISFKVAQGQVVGVIGPSASGKSSLARLLVGIWPPLSGSIRLDSAEIHSWNKLELGVHIGYLPQDIELFEGTVAENIARFNDLDSEKIVAAAQRAGVHELILHLPQGYDTQIGVGGNILSGGQRQRIALARTLYDNPRLVVLDEPNSNLDDLGESALLKAIQELKSRGSTVFVISHKISILSVVDQILLMKDGTLQLFGPRNEVIAKMSAATQAKDNTSRPLPPTLNNTGEK